MITGPSTVSNVSVVTSKVIVIHGIAVPKAAFNPWIAMFCVTMPAIWAAVTLRPRSGGRQPFGSSAPGNQVYRGVDNSIQRHPIERVVVDIGEPEFR